MKPSRATVVSYLLIVFLSGALVGVLAHRLYIIQGVAAGYRRGYVAEMTSRLKLSEEQVQQLNGILDEARNRYRAAREKIRPELDTIRQEQVEKIRAILSDAQQGEYAKLLEEREKRRHEK
jgi:hypothetical protein